MKLPDHIFTLWENLTPRAVWMCVWQLHFIVDGHAQIYDAPNACQETWTPNLVPLDSVTPPGVCEGKAGVFYYGLGSSAANCKLINTD